MTAVRFDDIPALQARISEDYGPWSEEWLITQEDVDTFGRVTGDMQWIHVDPERAKNTPMGGTIAHGFFVLSLLANLRKSDGLEITGQGSGLNYGIDRLRFTGPVPVSSRIHCRTRIEGVTAKSGGTMLDLGVAVHVVGEEKPCLLLAWKLLYLP
mgnify:CR=1 FL=1